MNKKTLVVPVTAFTSYGLFVLTVLFWLFVLNRLVSYPENHVGWNILITLPVFLLAGIVSLVAYRLTHRRRHVVAFYQFNVLIPYELWLERGMPPPFVGKRYSGSDYISLAPAAVKMCFDADPPPL